MMTKTSTHTLRLCGLHVERIAVFPVNVCTPSEYNDGMRDDAGAVGDQASVVAGWGGGSHTRITNAVRYSSLVLHGDIFAAIMRMREGPVACYQRCLS